MTGGLRDNASLMAMAALLCVAGAVSAAPRVAKAADLGGDCCADLEERVAELEFDDGPQGQQEGLGAALRQGQPRRGMVG